MEPRRSTVDAGGRARPRLNTIGQTSPTLLAKTLSVKVRVRNSILTHILRIESEPGPGPEPEPDPDPDPEPESVRI